MKIVNGYLIKFKVATVVVPFCIALAVPLAAVARCPGMGAEQKGSLSVAVSENVTVHLKDEVLVLEVNGVETSITSVKQEDNGPPTNVVALSGNLFAVLGPQTSYLVRLTSDSGRLALGSRDKLPTRYDIPCGLWAQTFGACPVAQATFSKALHGIVVSGWSGGSPEDFGAIVFSGENAGAHTLKSPDGAPLGYLWDDNAGHAVVRTQSGKGYLLSASTLVQCGNYPPLE
ncbi:hypothetical protein [Rhizobium sp. CCGE 510]|uniref:hypothetical protein n=1 Tax=Rhizobium sp. CCGE 510 TaxID=1132836 RepID=UPI0012F6C7EF|nr:hypothetical protein [Rhizobium sp. CCGE 510]